MPVLAAMTHEVMVRLYDGSDMKRSLMSLVKDSPLRGLWGSGWIMRALTSCYVLMVLYGSDANQGAGLLE